MTKVLTAIAGVVAGGAIVTGTAVALDANAHSVTVTKKLTIQHVVKGCHVWSDGTRQAAAMTLTLKRGTRLTITDMDIDPHQLVQTAGPRLSLHGHMMMGGTQSFVFKLAGLYRLTTKTVEMGPMMDAKTVGPDNKLRLTVRVT